MTATTALATGVSAATKQVPAVQLIPVAKVFASNKVNAASHRNALMSWDGFQYCSFWDGSGELKVGRRRRSSGDWQIASVGYRAAMRDAHNTTGLAVSSDRTLHLVYDHHSQPLRYRRSVKPGSLVFAAPSAMTGLRESSVTYPYFINSPDGRFYFLYRDGRSGSGDVLLNVFGDRWQPLHHPLITGAGSSNPYWWRPGVGRDGSLHLAWCWRRTLDAGTNRNVCYAVSRDGGRTWERSNGTRYLLPITDAQAEVVDPVEEGSNLINQCSAFVDHEGRPHLAHYRNDPDGVPQVFHLFLDRGIWRTHQVTSRLQPFKREGGGTLRLPLSRPDVVVNQSKVFLIYRDEEAGNRVRISWASLPDCTLWTHRDLTDTGVGAWEPNYDSVAMRELGRLELWVQFCEQASHERNVPTEPQPAYVLSVNLVALSAAER